MKIRAFVIGLTLLILSPIANALQLVVIDRLDCPACIAFKAEVGQAGYDASPLAEKVPLVFVAALNGRFIEPPEWFVDSLREGRIQKIRFTPTFLLLDDEDREVGRVIGYSHPGWFFEKITAIVDAYEASQR
jgi:hypothetical protein